MNRGTFMGRLTRDPEVKHTRSGLSVTSITLAANVRKKDDQGNWVDGDSVFFDVSIWGARGEAFARHHQRGDMALVEYQLRLDQWEQDGQRRQKLRGSCIDWHFLPRAADRPEPVEAIDPDTPF